MTIPDSYLVYAILVAIALAAAALGLLLWFSARGASVARAEEIFHNTSRLAEAFFGMLGDILLALLRKLAPFLVPFAPAWVFGHTVATTSGNAAVGFVAGLGLEAAGIFAAHRAIRAYVDNDRQWKIAAGAVVVYLIIGIGAIWILDDAAAQNFKVVGTAMFLISGMVYLLLGMEDAARVAERKLLAQETAEKESEAEKARAEADKAQADAAAAQAKALADAEVAKAKVLADAETDRAVRLAEVAAQKDIAVAKATVEADVARAEARKEKYALEQAQYTAEHAPVSANGNGHSAGHSRTDVERSPEYDELLLDIHERSGAKSFKIADVQEWTGLGRTAAYNLMNYGQQLEVVRQPGRGRYAIVQGALEATQE